MRDLTRGFAIATLESATVAGRAATVALDLAGFSRALVSSDPLRNVLSDGTIAPLSRRAVVHDLLEAKAAEESDSLVCWATLVEPAPDLPSTIAALVLLAGQAAELARAADGSGATLPAADSTGAAPLAPASAPGVVLALSGSELAGGRSAVRERLRGYADRCFQEVGNTAGLDDVEDELFRLSRVVETSPPLRRALSDPMVPLDSRVAVIADLLQGRASQATLRLGTYALVAGHQRDLAGTYVWLAEIAAEERGRRVAEVRSAVELDDTERARLAEALRRSTGRTVEVRVVVDPSVVGGMSVSIGDTVIDGTLRHRLDELREQLAPDAPPVLPDRSPAGASS